MMSGCIEKTTSLRTIGLFGGSFNPIHEGHVRLAHALCRAGIVDEVWFMVSPLNPFKQKGEHAGMLEGNYSDRVEMARLAIGEYPQLRVSTFEASLPRPSYTWNTMQALAKAYPQCTFVLMMGQDNWAQFDAWYHAQDLLANYDMIVYDRLSREPSVSSQSPSEGVRLWSHSKHTLQPIESAEPFPLFQVSSTDVRQAFATANQPFLDTWVAPAVQAYCRQHALYLAQQTNGEL